MRTLLAAAFLIPLIVLIQATDARAQNYPWCATGSYKDGARSCGFVTFEQCMASIKGAGGYCEQNAMYRPGGETPRVPRAPRR